MVNNSSASTKFQQHGRFRIPVGNPAARDYYLNDLFVPGSRTQSILTPLVRRFDTVADRFLGKNKSESLPGRTASEWNEIAEGINDSVNCVRTTADRDTSFLILTDYAHSDRGQLVVFVFCGAATKPVAVAKVRRTDTDGARLRREFDTIKRVRANEALQSSLPDPIALFETGKDTVFLESAAPGRSLHFLLRSNRPSEDEISKHFQLTFDWLAGFHRATFSKHVSIGEIADTYFASTTADIGTEESAVVEKLRPIMFDLRNEQLPMAAVQGDFWTRNVLLSEDERISVIDWEAFESEGLPLDDALMFTVSYALSFQWQFGKWEDPAEAFLRMFFSKDAPGSIAMRHLDDFCTRVGIDAHLLRVLVPLFLLRRVACVVRAGGDSGKNSEEVNRWRSLLRTYTQAA
jgi:hypothetical protein